MDIGILISISSFIFFTLISILMMRRYPKTYFSIIAVITIIFVSLFVCVFKDVMQMQKHFQNSTKIVFLEENGTFLTGLELSEEPKIIDKAFLQVYSRYYQEKNYSLILGNNYKMMIFSVKVIDELPNLIFQISEYTVSKENALLALRENDSLRYIVSNTSAPLSLNVNQNEQNDFLKASLFSVILTEGIMNPHEPLYFIMQYKKGNIYVYPETAVFKSIKYIPLGFMAKVAQKAADKLILRDGISNIESQS